MKKLLIINRNIIYREGLKSLFCSYDNSISVSELTYFYECFDFLSVRSNRPEFIIVCVDDSDFDVVDFLFDLLKKRYKSKVIILCNSHNVSFISSIWNTNVDSLLLSTTSFSNLIYVLENVSRETFSRYLDPLIIPQLNNNDLITEYEKQKMDSLSKQEKRVLQFLTNGLSNQEIGIQLNISERTVKNHLYSIYKKINCSDRTQAIIFALRNHIDNK